MTARRYQLHADEATHSCMQPFIQIVPIYHQNMKVFMENFGRVVGKKMLLHSFKENEGRKETF